ncbi:phosphatidylinositol transfer protein alpha isoform isoform X2 [Erpetoichthys calabaricus]|uniref:phosphatidylinositol transfer protein alpha isoform isoform X2 n=1 Tax=Erpetoichthys calabaricus TaxID=27687 RepID=UPI00109F1161|nr:phosphatidylinositol transfer protein alpha isoform isoform X2 [Erpetoichthys calabaricus]
MKREAVRALKSSKMSHMKKMVRRGSILTKSTACKAKFLHMCGCWLQQAPSIYTRRHGMPIHTAGQNEYMKDNFLIKIETWHKPDIGNQDNVHGLDPDTWKHVEVVYIDIADRSQVLHKDYKPEEDPAKYKSVKTGRGPLGPDWKKELPQKTDCPHMCAYKLVTIKFKWWGIQNKVESFIQKQERRLFTNFHRQLFCWIDRWIDLTMEDIRRMEDQTKKELDEMRVKDPVKGMTANED